MLMHLFFQVALFLERLYVKGLWDTLDVFAVELINRCLSLTSRLEAYKGNAFLVDICAGDHTLLRKELLDLLFGPILR